MTTRKNDDEFVRDLLLRTEAHDRLEEGEADAMLSAIRRSATAPAGDAPGPFSPDRPASAGSGRARSSTKETTSAKIVVAGGFGVGKTTLIGSVSEITPLTTEAVMTSAGQGVDDASTVPGKETTTVAMDFGRITMADDLILYLFGTPGQTRFWFMWDELIRGAVGAVVIVDTRRIADAFAPLDYFENRHLPYLVALNCFDGAPRFEPEEVREALAIEGHVPLVMFDARHRDSVKEVLISVVEHAMTRLAAEQRRGYTRADVHAH